MYIIKFIIVYTYWFSLELLTIFAIIKLVFYEIFKFNLHENWIRLGEMKHLVMTLRLIYRVFYHTNIIIKL